MRRIEDITLDNLEADFAPDFHASAMARRAELEALQERVCADYTAEIERRLDVLSAAYPRHTFEWESGNGVAYVHCTAPRGGWMKKGFYDVGFLREPFLRCEWQMKESGRFDRLNFTPARKRATLILWQEVEAIMALHLDADETFNIAI